MIEHAARVPDVGESRPMRILSSVDLPAPFGPSRPIRPGFRRRVTPRRASTDPKVRPSRRARSGGPSGGCRYSSSPCGPQGPTGLQGEPPLIVSLSGPYEPHPLSTIYAVHDVHYSSTHDEVNTPCMGCTVGPSHAGRGDRPCRLTIPPPGHFPPHVPHVPPCPSSRTPGTRRTSRAPRLTPDQVEFAMAMERYMRLQEPPVPDLARGPRGRRSPWDTGRS